MHPQILTVQLPENQQVVLGAILILRKDIGVGGCPENGNFPLLYVVKCPYVGGLVVQKSLKTPLRNIKMVP